jgi:hypothetical protein
MTCYFFLKINENLTKPDRQIRGSFELMRSLCADIDLTICYDVMFIYRMYIFLLTAKHIFKCLGYSTSQYTQYFFPSQCEEKLLLEHLIDVFIFQIDLIVSVSVTTNCKKSICIEKLGK